MSTALKVGVFDWPRFARGQDFYPDDLPPEWRLNYYANAFETACLPLSALPGPGEEREEWLDSLPPGFRLDLWIDDPALAGTIPLPRELGEAEAGCLLCETTLPSVEGWRRVDPDALLWRPGEERFRPVALLPRADSVPQLREWIESWLSLSEQSGNADCLWVEGSAVTPGQLEALRQLVELMGL